MIRPRQARQASLLLAIFVGCGTDPLPQNDGSVDSDAEMSALDGGMDGALLDAESMADGSMADGSVADVASTDGSTLGDSSLPDAVTSDSGNCDEGVGCDFPSACFTGIVECVEGVATCVEASPVLDGTACGDSLECIDGACVPTCSEGLTRCGTTCVDTMTAATDCGACGTVCGPDASCAAGTCRDGAALSSPGECIEIDQPGWLSCPSGMSCRCYYRYNRRTLEGSSLDIWRTEESIEVLAGSFPAATSLRTAAPASIALSAAPPFPQTGSTYPYTATVDALGAIVIEYSGSAGGYVPARSILTSSSDCGNRGRLLECSFSTFE